MKHCKFLVALISSLGLAACASGAKGPPGQHLTQGHTVEAWSAWQRGDASTAQLLAQKALPDAGDDARYILVLAHHFLGDHDRAISHRQSMSEEYPHLADLDEPLLWSYAYANRAQDGERYARKRGLTKDPFVRGQIDQFLNHPLRIEHGADQIELPFSDDALSEYLPGIDVTLNGRPTTARLDTGAPWLVVRAEDASQFGIKTGVCTTGFFSLTHGKICLGSADLTLGESKLFDVPVHILHGLDPKNETKSKFGVELGPIIGTQLLAHFLTTIDGRNQQLLLTNPANRELYEQHLSEARVTGNGQPFGLWSSHYLIGNAQTRDGDQYTFFLDSGLGALNQNGEQAAFLITDTPHAGLDYSNTTEKGFVRLNGAISFDNHTQSSSLSLAIPESAWTQFGSWGGMNVVGMLSWGFVKDSAWTIDFQNRRMWMGSQD